MPLRSKDFFRRTENEKEISSSPEETTTMPAAGKRTSSLNLLVASFPINCIRQGYMPMMRYLSLPADGFLCRDRFAN